MSVSTPLSVVSDLRPAATKIELRDVVKTYPTSSGGRVTAIEDVSFEVRSGEFVCLIGPSGCGKSTILNLLAGLDAPDAGEILVDGRPVRPPGPDRSLLFQEPALFPWLSVRNNVGYPLRLRGLDRSEIAATTQRWLAKAGLTDFADAQPHELSAGMRQRVALARALVCQPDVLLADEPFGSLDAQSREILQKELQLVWTELGNTFVFVTHNVREAAFLADRVIVLSARPGRPIAEYRITTPRPRSFEDVLVANVVVDIHDHLSEEVERAARETDRRADLA
ncbi:MAG TPA: ABC transporter ATP-binding protein [Actinomycetota bacterium]|nr:ABC transporter ATP-binding protein [Actinomycetota bacterium]